MDARDQRVGRQHKVFAGSQAHQRSVVAKLETRRARQRRKIAGDEIGFAGARRHGKRESGRARQ
jgi:hypothetical protein